MSQREQRLVFGEIAQQYDAARPTYPDAMFDAIVEFGELTPGDRVLDVGAGTGKATMSLVARGFDVLALEPTDMGALLAAKGVEVVRSTFEGYTASEPFALVCAAQSWHWVGGDRWDKLARAVAPCGTAALFWNKGRPHAEPFKSDNDAAYARLAPRLKSSIGSWTIDGLLAEFAACPAFGPVDHRVISWECTYSREEWVRLLGTHSDHRMLPVDVRRELHAAVGDAIDAHGGSLDVVYDTLLFMARRA